MGSIVPAADLASSFNVPPRWSETVVARPVFARPDAPSVAATIVTTTSTRRDLLKLRMFPPGGASGDRTAVAGTDTTAAMSVFRPAEGRAATSAAADRGDDVHVRAVLDGRVEGRPLAIHVDVDVPP